MKKYLDYVEEDIPNIFARWSMMAVLQAIEASKAIQTHIEVCIIYARLVTLFRVFSLIKLN